MGVEQEHWLESFFSDIRLQDLLLLHIHTTRINDGRIARRISYDVRVFAK
jgi:hypothetical protein